MLVFTKEVRTVTIYNTPSSPWHLPCQGWISGLHTANKSCQTQVVCERRKKQSANTATNRTTVFVDCFCAVHTHQLEFANTSLPSLVCRVKTVLGGDASVRIDVTDGEVKTFQTLILIYGEESVISGGGVR